MKLEDALQGLKEGRFRLLRRMKINNFSIVDDYDNLHTAIQEAKNKNDAAKERCASIYFYVAASDGEIIFPDE